MSRAIQSQADVGNLSLAGLGAFSSILATLSADNVVPMAVIQMGELGAALPTSGEYADKAKTLLQRCSDVRLDHLAIVIGWRKNDSASLMAESAGGQAVALVSMCLISLFTHANTGEILSRLCSRLLPSSMNVSSMSQLADVARLLSGKLSALGFGNMLAREVLKIHQVYEALGKPAPEDLLDFLDTESAIELFGSLSRALREDQKICRISGSRGMGHILGILQALFRRDITVTVEGTIIQDIEHSNIVCEIIQRDRSEPTRIHLETCIPTSKPLELPIAILRFPRFQRPYYGELAPYEYNWTGCIADHLQLIFLHYGFPCDQAVLDACCDLLVLVPGALNFAYGHSSFGGHSLLTLLGPLSRARICKICEEILRSKPTTSQMDLKTAFSNLVAIFTGKVQQIDYCECSGELQHDRMEDWKIKDKSRIEKEMKRCRICRLWIDIGKTLHSMLWCFFVNAGPNTTISLAREHECDIITRAVTGDIQTLHAEYIMYHVARVVNISRNPNEYEAEIAWASGSNSCTIYPTVLESLSVPSHQSVVFTLTEGVIVFEGRYHETLQADYASPRELTRYDFKADEVRPSLSGMNVSSPIITIRETFNSIEVLCSLKTSGHDTKVDLRMVILGYIGMQWADPCHHPMTDLMDLDRDRFRITSVALPLAEEQFGVVMARWNPMV